jgi:hypothetical protein
MSFFHQFELPENSSKYFRYVGGQPSEISATEFQATIGSGIHARITALSADGRQGSIGGAWYGIGGTRVVTAGIVGSSVKGLGGAVNGTLIFPDLTIIYKVNVTGISFGPDGEGPDGPGGGGGSGGGGSGGGGDGPPVADPREPPRQQPPRPLPPGNGNGGFQSSGTGGGTQLGITGGN